MPKAYWIAHVTVNDAERYKDYVSTAKPALISPDRSDSRPGASLRKV